MSREKDEQGEWSEADIEAGEAAKVEQQVKLKVNQAVTMRDACWAEILAGR